MAHTITEQYMYIILYKYIITCYSHILVLYSTIAAETTTAQHKIFKHYIKYTKVYSFYDYWIGQELVGDKQTKYMHSWLSSVDQVTIFNAAASIKMQVTDKQVLQRLNILSITFKKDNTFGTDEWMSQVWHQVHTATYNTTKLSREIVQIYLVEKLTQFYINTIPVGNSWRKGSLLNKTKDLFRWGTDDWMLSLTLPMAFLQVWTNGFVFTRQTL